MSNLTNALAIDCEMVGAGNHGSQAARVSLVNEYGECVYDAYIKPDKEVTDYRTYVSGITRAQLAQGKQLNVVKQDVASYIKGRILVGHSVDKDLGVLNLTHPEGNIRDIAKKYQTGMEKPSLKDLALKYLGLAIQNGPHDSVEDAKATMRLYKRVNY